MNPPDGDDDPELFSPPTEPGGPSSSFLAALDTAVHPTEDKIAVSKPPVYDRPTLTMITGPEAGSLRALDGAETLLGRARTCHVVVDDLTASRKHARIVRLADGAFLLEDLGSRNGTTVHGLPIRTHRLVDGDRIGVGTSIFLRFAYTDRTEEDLLRGLYSSSIRDALTGAVNRKHLLERLATEIAFARRHTTSLSILIFDIDHFKRVNDTFGHLAGDQVLRDLSSVVRSTLRAEDILARYGGEEFVIVARGIGVEQATLFGERIRGVLEKATLRYEDHAIRVTISVGIASLSCCKAGAGVEQLLALADARLYDAKRAGRNRCVGSSSASSAP